MSGSAVISDKAWARYCRAETERLLCRYSQGISGMYGVQLAGWTLSDETMDGLALRALFRFSPDCKQDNDLQGDLAYLPFESESLALVLVPFGLDGITRPEAVLEEVDRVLMPEGHLVLMTTNPGTPWTLVAPRPLPGTTRTVRYLALRGYDIGVRRRYLYRPPLADQQWLDRLAFMDRLRLGLGGAGLVIARKRVIGVTPSGMRLAVKPRSRRNRAGVPAGLAGGGLS